MQQPPFCAQRLGRKGEGVAHERRPHLRLCRGRGLCVVPSGHQVAGSVGWRATSSARARASVAAAVGPEARVAGEESIRWSFSLVRALSSMIADVQYRLRKWPSGAEASCDEAASLRMCLPPSPYLRRVGRVSGGSRRLWSERRRWLTGSSSAVEQRCREVNACVLKLVP